MNVTTENVRTLFFATRENERNVDKPISLPSFLQIKIHKMPPTTNPTALPIAAPIGPPTSPPRVPPSAVPVPIKSVCRFSLKENVPASY